VSAAISMQLVAESWQKEEQDQVEGQECGKTF